MELRIDKSDWVRTRLGDVCTWYQRDIPNDAQEECGIEFYVTANHIDGGEVRFNRYDSLSDGQKGPTITKHFEEGDLLLSTRSVALRKAAIAPVSGVTGEKLLVLRTSVDSDLISDLMPFVFQSDDFWNYAQNSASGSVNKFTSWTKIRDYEFLLPPKDQQAEIAELLWALEDMFQEKMTMLGALEVYSDVRSESFVQECFDLSPSVELAKTVQADRPITYGILKPGKGQLEGVPVVKVRDYPNGEINEDKLLLTSEEIASEYARSKLCSGDLLLSIRGSVGRTAIVPDSLHGANITQDTARIGVAKDFDVNFIRVVLGSRRLQRDMAVRTVGNAVKGINLGDVRRLKIPVVDLAVQEEIGKFKVAMEGLCDEAGGVLMTLTCLKRALLGAIFDN